MQPEFTNWRSEQRSWLETCALLDQSHHMTDLFIEGPDALRLLSDTGVNTFANFAVGKAKQFVAVNPDGHLIGDAILFHLEEELFDLVGHPMVLDWVTFNLERGDYEATVERDDNSIVRAVRPAEVLPLRAAGTDRPRADGGGARHRGARGQVLQHDRVHHRRQARPRPAARHGRPAGLRALRPLGGRRRRPRGRCSGRARTTGSCGSGSKAYSTANLGSGWVPAPMPALFSDHPLMQEYREWLPVAKVGSIGGSLDSADISDYYLTPFDIGYGKTVKFDHEFIGREALERLSQTPPPRTKVTLVWNADDVTAAIGSLYRPGPGAKYIDMPKARYATHHEDTVLKDGQQVGISLDCGYLANEREMVSLASDRHRAQRAGHRGGRRLGREAGLGQAGGRGARAGRDPGHRRTVPLRRPGHLPLPLTPADVKGPRTIVRGPYDGSRSGGLRDPVVEQGDAGRGVGRRHEVVRVDLRDPVVHRPPHDQPHDQVDALRAGLADQLLAGEPGERGRVGLDPLHPHGVELRVDEPRPGPGQLVRHAAGPEHADGDVLGVAADRPAQRLAELVAPGGRGLGVLDDVDEQRDDRAGPCVAGVR